MSSGYQPVAEFYNGKSIFITGVTGFVGKVLLEKLLRSCPGLKKIYILMRTKHGVSVSKRIDSLLDSKLFKHLEEAQPNYREKICTITGDILEPAMGISEEDEKILVEECNIIFHSAATVRFEERMKDAININIRGCSKILHLARRMQNLNALVHISTAYSNCEKKHRIDEIVYEPKLLPQKLLDAEEWMDAGILDQLTPTLIEDKPNTYTYTKQLAEYLVADTCDGIPLVIVRPSIVGGSWLEPFTGWVDNFNGATGVLAATGKGLMRSIMCDSDAVADIIPVDIVVNCLIVSAWHMAVKKPRNIPIYNCTSGQLNRITWGCFTRIVKEVMTNNPLDNVVRLPDPQTTKSPTWHTLKLIFDQQLPCLMMDFWLYVTGNKAFFCRANNRIKRNVHTLKYFTTNEWEFSNANVLGLLEQMSPSDKKDFNFDVRRMNWRQYVENYCLGIRTYTLKEDMQNISTARRRIKQLQRLSFLFNTVLAIVVWRLAIRKVKVAQTMWYIMLNLTSKMFQRVPKIARS